MFYSPNYIEWLNAMAETAGWFWGERLGSGVQSASLNKESKEETSEVSWESLFNYLMSIQNFCSYISRW